MTGEPSSVRRLSVPVSVSTAVTVPVVPLAIPSRRVFQCHHAVAALVGPLVDVEDGSDEKTRVGQAGTGEAVEVVDVAPAHGEHDGAFAAHVRCGVVGGDAVSSDRGGRGHCEPIVRLIRAECFGQPSIAQLRERGPFPFAALPAILMEMHAAEAVIEAAQKPTGVDFGKLLGVANEHDLGACQLRGSQERFERSGSRHARFVDDQHGSWSELRAAREVSAERCDRVRRDPGGGFELTGGLGGDGAADHAAASELPCFAGCREGGRLARSRRCDHHVDAPTGRREDADHRPLFV